MYGIVKYHHSDEQFGVVRVFFFQRCRWFSEQVETTIDHESVDQIATKKNFKKQWIR